jgi:FkbM family methyltransferase
MLFPANDKWAGRSFDLYGEAYEPQVSFMLKFVRSGDVVIDAGANIGSMTIPLAQAVGPDGAVIAIEPQQFLYYVLCGNIAANNLYNVRAIHKAVEADSLQKLFCPSARLKSNDGVPFYDDHLQHYGGVFLTDEPRSDTDDVIQTIALDDLELPRLNFLKLDIEGAEVAALEGAEKTIRRCRPIMFIESMPWDMPKIVEAVQELDYVYRSCRIRFFNPDNFFKNPVDELREETHPDHPMMSSDIFCYPRDLGDEYDLRYFRAIKETL